MSKNDQYNAEYKYKREFLRDKDTLVGEMASAPESDMNDAIEKAYQKLSDKERVVIDGLLYMLQQHAEKRGRRGFGDMSRKELLVKLGLFFIDNGVVK